MHATYKGGQPLTLEMVAEMTVNAVLSTGNAVPHLFVQGKEGVSVVVIPDVPETFEQREKLFHFIGWKSKYELSAIGKLLDIFFTVEAWMVAIPRSEKDTFLAEGVTPSNHPDRIEIVIISHIHVPTNGFNVEIFQIKRDTKGELRELVQMPKTDAEVEGESNLLNAFIHGWNS